MVLSLDTDRFGHLTCSIRQGEIAATVTASNMPDAASDLLAAVNSLTGSGHGECFWREGGGEYRWVLRQSGERLTVVILWSTGTLTGWENAFWAECDAAEFSGLVRTQVSRLRAPAD